LAAIAASDLVEQHAPALADAALEAATPQIRNRASLAGNLLQRPRCWYLRSADLVCNKKGGKTCPAVGGRNKFHAVFGNPNCPVVHPSNLAPVLWALEARVQVAGSNGATRSLTMPEFLLMPQQPDGKENGLNTGDVVLGVELPKPSATKGQAYREAREKQSFDWALVSAAVALELSGGKIQSARVVLGAVAPIPWRVEAAERALVGKSPSAEAFRSAAEAAFADAKPLAENGYKVPLGKAVLIDALTAATNPGGR
jgi:xanthine dehydrogenase YagS FAD-binding subunit